LPRSEEFKRLGAFDNNPKRATADNPAECYGYKFLETLGFFRAGPVAVFGNRSFAESSRTGRFAS